MRPGRDAIRAESLVRSHVGTLFEDDEFDAVPVFAEEILGFSRAESRSPSRRSDEQQERWPIHAAVRPLTAAERRQTP